VTETEKPRRDWMGASLLLAELLFVLVGLSLDPRDSWGQ